MNVHIIINRGPEWSEILEIWGDPEKAAQEASKFESGERKIGAGYEQLRGFCSIVVEKHKVKK